MRTQINPLRQLWARPYQLVRQLWTRPYQSVRQHATISTLLQDFPPPPHIAWGSLLLSVANSWSSLPPHTKARGTHIPLLPFWAWYPLMRPHGLDMAIWRYHRQSDWSQDHDGRYFSSWNDLAVEKTASKSSVVSAQEGGMLYWPACWVAYKRKSRRAWSLVCSQRSTPPHPSWTQPELHHLDTVCWISKFPTMPLSFGRALIIRGAPFPINQANLSAPPPRGTPFPINQANLSALLPGACPFLSIRQTWARLPPWGAPFPINQANLSSPFSQGRALSFLSSSVPRT